MAKKTSPIPARKPSEPAKPVPVDPKISGEEKPSQAPPKPRSDLEVIEDVLFRTHATITFSKNLGGKRRVYLKGGRSYGSLRRDYDSLTDLFKALKALG